MDWKGVEERIVQDDQNKWDQKVSSSQLHVTRARVLELTDGGGPIECYTLSDLAAGQMCQRLGIPVSYYRRLPGEMKAPVSNRLLRCRDSSPPVTWLATTKHYSHNEDEIRFDGVNPVPRTYVRGIGALPSRGVQNIHPRAHARGVLWYGVNGALTRSTIMVY